jgi:hypothetical protein
MVAVLHGAQHRKSCQLRLCIGWIKQLRSANNKKIGNHQLKKLKF